jgi:glycosyltransferase involved in cell wall biosynthesis
VADKTFDPRFRPEENYKYLKSKSAVRMHTVEALSKNIPPGSSLMHINCGEGEITYLLRLRGTVLNVLGIDPDEGANGGRFPFQQCDTEHIPTDRLHTYDIVLIDNSAGNLSNERVYELTNWAIDRCYKVFHLYSSSGTVAAIQNTSWNTYTLLTYETEGKESVYTLQSHQFKSDIEVEQYYRTDVAGNLIEVKDEYTVPPEKGARTHALFARAKDADGSDIWTKRYFSQIRPPLIEMYLYQWLAAQDIETITPKGYHCVYGFTFPFDEDAFGNTGITPDVYHGPKQSELKTLASTILDHPDLPNVTLYELSPFQVIPTADGPKLFRFEPREAFNTGRSKTSQSRHIALKGDEKPRLMWVGDAQIQTGLGRVSSNFLGRLHNLGWDITQLGTNYDGDPHDEPYTIYPAQRAMDVVPGVKQDWAGVRRLETLCERHKPHILMINLDPWNVVPYTQVVSTWWGTRIPLIGCYIAVDSLNMRKDIASSLSGLDLTIFHTQFGADQAIAAGFTGKYDIIPHGVDTSIYKPMDRTEARTDLAITSVASHGDFLFGNVGRNQPRKRMDLTIRAFAKWIERYDIPTTVKLYLHTRQKDVGYDLGQLANYYMGKNRVILPNDVDLLHDFPEERMTAVYNSVDVHVNNSTGEGWGLTTLESMACGIPQIAPNFAALGEWPKGAVHYVDIAHWDTTPDGINTIHGVPSEEGLIQAFEKLYRDAEYRKELGQKALARATDPEFNWDNLADRLHNALLGIIDRQAKVASK